MGGKLGGGNDEAAGFSRDTEDDVLLFGGSLAGGGVENGTGGDAELFGGSQIGAGTDGVTTFSGNLAGGSSPVEDFTLFGGGGLAGGGVEWML